MELSLKRSGSDFCHPKLNGRPIGEIGLDSRLCSLGIAAEYGEDAHVVISTLTSMEDFRQAI